MPLSDEFHLEEYKSLREEILRDVAEIKVIERESIIASALIYSWFLTQDLSYSIRSIIIIVPIVLILAGMARIRVLSKWMERHVEYIVGLEKKVNDPVSVGERNVDLGWEHYLRRTSPANDLLTRISRNRWPLYLLGTFAAAVMLWPVR